MSAKRCRGVLFAILVYVTLDLSLPAMPGAFVFEPADSAESTQVRAQPQRGPVLSSSSTLIPAPLAGVIMSASTGELLDTAPRLSSSSFTRPFPRFDGSGEG